MVTKRPRHTHSQNSVDNIQDKTELSTAQVQWFPGHMKKTKELISKHLKYIDVIIEVLDARAPLSSHNPLLQVIFKNSNKKKIIVLNKIDLADDVKTQQWIKEYTNPNTTVVVLNALNDNVLKLIYNACVSQFKSSKWFGKRAIVGMIVGIPNVGKSTIINYLIKKKKAKVGDRPGVTQSKQWIKINKNLEIIDTPGLLWTKFEDPLVGVKLSLLGIIKDEVVELDLIVEYGIFFMLQNYPTMLKERYGITLTDLEKNIENQNLKNIEEFKKKSFLALAVLEKIAVARHFLKKSGAVDCERAGKIFLKELRDGKLGKIVLD